MHYTLKKLRPSIIISVIVILVSCLIYMFSINAIDISDSEMSVTKHQMNVTIERNGAIYVTEDVTLKFDSYWNYLIKDIGFKKDESVETQLGFSINDAQSSFDEGSFKVEMYNENGELLSPSINDNRDLDQNKYRSYEMRLNGAFVTGVRMHYEYRILDAVTVYNDIAELNWILIDDLDYRTKNININIKLPDAINNEDEIMFFGHGVSRDNAVKQEGKMFKINIDKLRSGEMVEVRILFDKNAIESNKIITKDAKEVILDIEENIAKSQEQLRRNYNISSIVVLTAFILMVIMVAFKVKRVYFKFDKERVSNFDSQYYRELPNTYSPAEMGMLINYNELGKNELEATLMDLIRRKYILLDMNGCSTLDEKPNYKFILNEEKKNNDLKEHERKLLDWFFDDIADGNELTLNQLDEYLSKERNAKKYLEASKEWGQSVLNESRKNDFFDDVGEAKKESSFAISLAFLVAVVAFFGYVVGGFNEGIVLIGIAIAIGIIFSAYVAQIKRRSFQGNEDYVRWLAFKNFLLDFSNFDDYPMPSIIVWEHYLVYATEFGIAGKVEEQMRLKFEKMDLNIQEYLQTNSSSYMRYHFSCYYFHHRISSTYVIARSTIQKAEAARAASSGSGGKGGFGGGRSFGGGGGGMRGGR